MNKPLFVGKISFDFKANQSPKGMKMVSDLLTLLLFIGLDLPIMDEVL